MWTSGVQLEFKREQTKDTNQKVEKIRQTFNAGDSVTYRTDHKHETFIRIHIFRVLTLLRPLGGIAHTAVRQK